MLIVITCAFYYKHITVVNDDSSVISEWHSSCIDDVRVIILDHNMFIIQATGDNSKKLFFFGTEAPAK